MIVLRFIFFIITGLMLAFMLYATSDFLYDCFHGTTKEKFGEIFNCLLAAWVVILMLFALNFAFGYIDIVMR
jgi:hypothetical protein